jgi:glutamate racemase
LGCTHYPLLKRVIAKIMGKEVKLIDSAEETAREVKKILMEERLLKKPNKASFRRFYVSDIPDRFVEVGERFLKDKITEVERVDIEKY